MAERMQPPVAEGRLLRPDGVPGLLEDCSGLRSRCTLMFAFISLRSAMPVPVGGLEPSTCCSYRAGVAIWSFGSKFLTVTLHFSDVRRRRLPDTAPGAFFAWRTTETVHLHTVFIIISRLMALADDLLPVRTGLRSWLRKDDWKDALPGFLKSHDGWWRLYADTGAVQSG